jgi:N-acetylglucosaminyl-diphospho-decaprenol L-rhamnosyltransferase
MADAPADTQAPSPATPRVRVIVVNYNAGLHLARCLTALAAQTITDFEVIVVDNASTDDSLIDAVPDDPRFRVNRQSENTGFAAGNNIGAQGCTAEWIATLNPDAFAAADWLERLLAAAARHPGAAMFGSTQIDAADPDRLDGSGDAYLAAGFAWRGNHGRTARDLPAEGTVFSPCAAAALYRRTAFEAADGFDESFFCYYEDVDLAFRLRLAGEYCVQVPDAVVEHIGGATSGKRSEFVRYHSARNRPWLFVKNMPGALFWTLLPAHVLLHVALLAWAVVRGHGGSTWRGLRHSLRGLRPVLSNRRRIQARRRATTRDIAAALTWSPLKLLHRSHDVRDFGGPSIE